MEQAGYQPDSLDTDALRSLALIRNEDDRRDLSQRICRDLANRGFDVHVLVSGEVPGDVDAVVRYEATWVVGIVWYPMGISISLYDKDSEQLLAGQAVYRHKDASRPIDSRVAELLDALVGTRTDYAPSPAANCQGDEGNE